MRGNKQIMLIKTFMEQRIIEEISAWGLDVSEINFSMKIKGGKVEGKMNVNFNSGYEKIISHIQQEYDDAILPDNLLESPKLIKKDNN